MNDQDVRDFLERMATEEPVPFLDAEPLTRRARRRAARTAIGGAIGVAAAIAVLFGGVSLLRDDVASNRPADRPTPTEPILRTAGEILWLGGKDGDDDLLAVNPVTGEERVVAEDIDLDDARWSADGRWVAFWYPPSLWVVDAEREPRNVMNFPPESGRGSWDWSSNGARLAVHLNSRLHIIDPATAQRTELGSTAGSASAFAWSPDDSRIVFGVDPRSIRSVDVRTGEASPVVELAGHVEGIAAFAWSPDGSRLAVHVDTTMGNQLIAMNADGSGIRTIAEGEIWLGGSDGSSAHWSPDGSRIVFAEAHRPEERIWVVPADGSTEPVLLATARASDFRWGSPVWSPDGSQIAFSIEPGRAFVIDADGSGNAERVDDLTYASWSGGSFCWDCLWWINETVAYTGGSET